MAPIPGVHIVKGDITRKETVDEILSKFEGNKAELVVCDGAPDGIIDLIKFFIVLGLHEVDQYIQFQLLLSVMMLANSKHRH